MSAADEFDDDARDEDDDEEGSSDAWTSPHEDEIERLCREALSLLEDDQGDEARAAASDAVALDDRHPFPYFVLGVIAEHEADLPTARYLSDQALRRAATNSDAIQFRAQIHLREFEFAQAERLLRFGIAHNPEDPDLHEQLARVCLAEGKAEEAVAAAAASIRLDPSGSTAHAVRVAALEQTGDVETMLAVLRQAAQLHPDDPYAMVELAQVEAEQGNLERARVLLGRAQRLAPRDADIAQARTIIESGHEHPLLRPLPRLTQWLREFPGGLVGLVVALILASLPMHELVTQDPAYAVPVAILLGLWACVALYLWLAPAVLSVILSRAAGDVAARDPLSLTEPERTLDAVVLCFAGKRSQQGLDTLAQAATSSQEPASTELWRLHDRLSSRPRRIAYALTRMPAQTRLLVAIAVTLVAASPQIGRSTGTHPWIWQLVALAILLVSWAQARFEHNTQMAVSRGLALAAVVDEEHRRAA